MGRNFEHNYVYLLRDDANIPFYVGLGAVTRVCELGYRPKQHIREGQRYYLHGTLKEGANIQKLETIKKILMAGRDVKIEIVAVNLSRDEANQLERNLIAKFGRADHKKGPLTNKNDGGSGSCAPSKATRDAIRRANTGKIVSDETRKRQSLARKGRQITPEWRAKISAYQKGREHSDESNAKVGKATKRRWTDLAYRAEMVQKLKAKWRVVFPDGHEEIRLGLTDLLVENPELRMSQLSQSGRRGKPYKGYLAYKLPKDYSGRPE